MPWFGLAPRALLVGVLVASTVGLTACTRSVAAPTVEAKPAAPAKLQANWPGCPALRAFEDSGWSSERPTAGSLPAGFVPAEAVVCAVGERTTADGALVQAGLERRATDIGPLLTYLARPGEVSSTPEELICPAIAVLPPWLFLTDDDGRWVAPALPTDACGFPLGTSGGGGPPAYEQLRYRETVVQHLRTLETPESRASGCAMDWKNEVAVLAADQPRAAPLDRDPFDGDEVRVCGYAVPEEERSSSSPAGAFLGGQVLDDRERRGLLAALVGAPAASAACDQPASRFAVLAGTRRTDPVYVELDGCRRILHGTSSFAAADADLVVLIEDLSR